MSTNVSVLEHFTGQDVFAAIRAHEQATQVDDRNLFTRIRDYAAYGVAVSQRFLFHGIAAVGLERIIEGKYEQGLIVLSVAPYAALLDRVIYTRNGNIVSKAQAVVDYLVGIDLLRYVRASEQISDRVENRRLPDKIMDYFSYFGAFTLRYAPTIVEIDGIRRLMMGQYKIGMLEIGGGLYKNLWDYYRYRRRMRWIKFYERVHKLGLIDQIMEP